MEEVTRSPYPNTAPDRLYLNTESYCSSIVSPKTPQHNEEPALLDPSAAFVPEHSRSGVLRWHAN